MTTIISSQRYLSDTIIAEKVAANDVTVSLSPIFEVDGVEYQVVLDGHHSLEAAHVLGIDPEYSVLDATDCDAITMLEHGDVEEFLLASWMDSDYYDVATDRVIW